MVLALPARAKLNTRLEVTGVRPDGRHALSTDLVTVSLSDLLEVAASDLSTLEVTGLELPAGENLIVRARIELEAAAGRALPADFRLHKRIPPGSGLGGGSSDAATSLRALAMLYGLDLDLDPVAALVGSDVPFLLCGGAATAGGAGDELAPTPSPPGWFAIAWPGFALATADVYAAYDRVGGEGRNHLRRAAETLDPRVATFAAELGEGWEMTGSGSAFYRSATTRLEADAAVAALTCWTAVVQAVPRWC